MLAVFDKMRRSVLGDERFMDKIWYYADGDKTVGPMSLTDIRAVLTRVSSAGRLLVWRNGFTTWVEAESVPELADAHPRIALTLSRFVGGAIVVITSFFVTLWLTEPTPKQIEAQSGAAANISESDKLAGMHVSNLEELKKSAADAGLVPARSLTGALDAVTRLNEREVTAAGWLADPGGDATPLTIIAFVDGKSVAIGKTSGERPDIDAAFGLTSGTQKNVAFKVTFNCTAGLMPIIVGIGPDRQYHALGSNRSC
jgi:uncharacterized protein DUF4339